MRSEHKFILFQIRFQFVQIYERRKRLIFLYFYILLQTMGKRKGKKEAGFETGLKGRSGIVVVAAIIL